MRTRHPHRRTTALSHAKHAPDRILFALTVALAALGVIAVADTSSPQAISAFGDPWYFAKQQAIWAVVGVAAMIVTSSIHFTYWKKVAYPAMVVSLILLVVVLIPGIGVKIYGARRWLSLGAFGFQPSEVIKLALAMFFAKLSQDKAPWSWYLGTIGVITALVMLQPDLGTNLIIAGIGVIQLFVAGIPLSFFGLAMGGGGLIGTLLILLSDYRRERFMTYIHGATDPLGSSYHIRQVLIALGSGGVFGVGIGQSKQKHLFLPETATDSVFAVIGEEVGFIGTMLIVSILFYFLYRMARIIGKTKDPFAKLLAVGIAGWMGVQIALNIGSMTAITPLTGIPLPFFSYGGTSLTMILAAIGIVINISRYTDET